MACLLRLISGQQSLALIDQVVVSGTNFLTTILIGRWCGASELGAYALGFSLLVTLACIQESLISLPYTIYWHRSERKVQAAYAGTVLVHHTLLSLLALIALTVTAVALSLVEMVPGLASVIWVLTGVMPLALLREFGRRFAFAHLRMAQTLVLDLAVSAVQLGGLLWLVQAGTLSAATAYVAIGAACVLTVPIWLFLARGNFAIRWEQVRPTMQQSWSLGKWFFASQLTVSVQAYFVHWLLAVALGAEVTGVYAACLTVVLLSNPLTLGFCNALAPRTAQAFSEGGAAALSRVVVQATLLLGTSMALFCMVILLAGEQVMGLLYDGAQYQGHGHTVTVLALAYLASALGMPATNGLAAVERPDLIFKAGLFAIGLTVFLIPCLVGEYGITGAAYGFLAGNMAGSAGRWVAFSAYIRRSSHGTPFDPQFALVTGVLEQFTPSAEENAWVIEKINEGAQATIFAVRRRDGRAIWQTHLGLAVKLYKSGARQGVELMREQFLSLSRLHAKLNDRTINGWKIHVPRPVFQCERPLAVVMTIVPGRSLYSCLETACRSMSDAMGSIADAVVAAMEQHWLSDAQAHGDLNLDNILCDEVTRSLSFVDPGVLSDSFLGNGATRQWYPGSRDLAYMLYDTGVAMKRTLGNPGARRRQQDLVERVLRAFMKKTAPTGQEHRLLDEIQACVNVHLNGLRVSWSPRGIWHLFLRRIAGRRLGKIFGRLRGSDVT